MLVQLIGFYSLLWFLIVLIGGGQQFLGIIPVQIGLPQMAPGLSALLIVALSRKNKVKIQFFDRSIPFFRYFWAAAIPAGVGLLIFALVKVLAIPTGKIPDAYSDLSLIALWAPLGAFGEEIGWRGYLNKLLHQKATGYVSAIAVGLLWFPIHLFNFAGAELSLYVFMAIWFAAVSVVIFAFVRDHHFSVVIAALFHVSINFTQLLFLDVMNNPLFWMVNALVWTLIAVGIIIKASNLFFLRSKRQDL